MGFPGEINSNTVRPFHDPDQGALCQDFPASHTGPSGDMLAAALWFPDHLIAAHDVTTTLPIHPYRRDSDDVFWFSSSWPV